MKKIYYLINSTNWGDTFLSTPTLRYLSKSHERKLNVVTHRKDVFKNNPYVQDVLSFDEFNKLNLSDIIKYESFTYAGRKDNNGIEKKFAHFDVRQLHAMDLGFQLPTTDLSYDFYPDPLNLDINLPEKYVVLHVTTNWPNRTWSYNNWVELIKWLKEKNIFTVLIGFGYREELHKSYSDKPLDKECPMFDDYYGLDLTNKGSMSDMFWVMNGSQAVITMDSAPLHLASCTDAHIIQLGSAINPEFKRFYRNGDWTYKYHFLGGSCKLFCNTNLFYNIKEWGDINSVPPQPYCLENKPTFECHPSIDNVIEKLQEILVIDKVKNFDNYLEFIPSDNQNKINFNFKKTLNKEVRIESIDVTTGLKRDIWVGNCTKLDTGHYWWSPSPGRLENLGNIYLKLFIDNEFIDEVLLEYSGGKKFTVSNIEYHLENNDDCNYTTFWEIYINNEYEIDGKSIVDKDDIILDIGANFGFFALYSVDCGAKKIYAVEPFSTAYNNLEKLSKEFPIIPINKAIHTNNDGVTMLLNSKSSASNCLLENNEFFNNDGEKVLVNSININDLISSLDTKIDLLKVDCEGSELVLFDTITSESISKINKMVIETHSDDISNIIKNKLFDNGFLIKEKNNILFAFNLSDIV